MKILGPNQTGKGILIEMDAGFVNPKDRLNEDFGRVYPERILKREADRYKTAIKKGLSTSELNHPESSLIDLDRVSHIITDVWWDNNILMGKLKLLTSPGFHESGVVSTKGDIAANLMRQGVTMGVSSRGVGSLKKVGEQNEVQDDFELICFDLVSSPSTPGAYLFSNPEDRNNYEENLEEERKVHQEEKGFGKSVDLMKRLYDYLGK
jgi:hypothetical protein